MLVSCISLDAEILIAMESLEKFTSPSVSPRSPEVWMCGPGPPESPGQTLDTPTPLALGSWGYRTPLLPLLPLLPLPPLPLLLVATHK